jgi:hypothetical protein
MSGRLPTLLRFLGACASAAGICTATLATAEQRGNCGYGGLEIIYQEPKELNSTCQALADVLRYFKGIGFEIAPKVSVTFVVRDRAQGSGLAVSLGHFDALKAQILIYRSTESRTLGSPWRERIAASLLRHEFAHMAIWQILGRGVGRLRREWHEFIVYAVQFDLMDAALRDQLLEKHVGLRQVESLLEVNEFTYAMDPEAFAVIAYKTYRARGAAEFVRQLLRSEIVPSPPSHPGPD